MKPITLAAALVALSALSAATVQAQTLLTVEGPGARIALSVGDLALLPHDTVRVQFHEQPAQLYRAIPLAALLARVGVRADSLRGPALQRRVVVEAADGYRIVLSLAECDPSLTDRRVLLADAVDGHALPANEAPLRLLMPGDPRHSRWARQVVALRVRGEEP